MCGGGVIRAEERVAKGLKGRETEREKERGRAPKPFSLSFGICDDVICDDEILQRERTEGWTFGERASSHSDTPKCYGCMRKRMFRLVSGVTWCFAQALCVCMC